MGPGAKAKICRRGRALCARVTGEPAWTTPSTVEGDGAGGRLGRGGTAVTFAVRLIGWPKVGVVGRGQGDGRGALGHSLGQGAADGTVEVGITVIRDADLQGTGIEAGGLERGAAAAQGNVWLTPATEMVTVPEGVPEAGGTAATVAVKVTVWP